MNCIRLFFIVIVFVLTGCVTNISLIDHVDKNQSFGVNISKKDTLTEYLTNTEGFQMIVGSEKHSQFIQWINNNQSGWQWTPASYITDLSVGQGSFRLLHTIGTEGVVVAFTDKENKPRQYMKTIKKGELDFLIK